MDDQASTVRFCRKAKDFVFEVVFQMKGAEQITVYGVTKYQRTAGAYSVRLGTEVPASSLETSQTGTSVSFKTTNRHSLAVMSEFYYSMGKVIRL
jgi:hypothetical protein